MIIKTEDIGEMRQTPIGELMIKDANILTYPSGKFYVQYLYDGLLEKMAEDMRHNLTRGYDNMIVTQGAEGSGKSTHVFQICRAYDPDFTIAGNYVYDFEAMKERLNSEEDDTGGIFWLDEAVNMANKRRWQSQENTDLTDLLIMMRSRSWCIDFCIPRAADLDFYIREHRFRYLVTVKPMTFPRAGKKDRGYFELKRKNPTTGVLELVGYGEYDDMPPEAKKEYEKVKESAQLKKFGEIANKKEGYRKKYEEERAKIRNAILVLHNSGVKKDTIKDLFSIESDSTFYNILQRARKDGKN